MRLLLVLLCVAGTAGAQPQDAPLRLRLELRSLQQEREDVSLVAPVVVTSVGLGVLLTGALFDAATANLRRPGEASIAGVLCYLASSLLVPGGFMALVGRLVERGMLSSHANDVRVELAMAEGR